MSKALFLNSYPDFSNYFVGPQLAFSNQNPYLPDLKLFTPTTYPPVIFVIFYPLHFAQEILASKLWTIGSIISLLASLLIFFKTYKQNLFSNIALILSGLTFLAFPVKFTLGMGQINLYILLLLTLFVYYLSKQKPISGIFLGLALVIKLFPILLIPYLFFIKKWKELALIGITFLVFSVLTLTFIDRQTLTFYFEKIFPTLLNSWKLDYYNQSLSGVIGRTSLGLAQKELLRTFLTGVLITTTFIVVLKNKKSKDLNLKIGAIITLTLLINNFSWQHHFVWLVIPFFSTFFYITKLKNRTKFYALLFGSYILVAANLKDPNIFPLILQSHVFWGAIILLVLELYLIRRKTI